MKLTGSINDDAIDIAVYFNGYDGIQRMESVEADVNALKTSVDGMESDVGALETAVSTLDANKADASDVYTKAQTNTLIPSVSVQTLATTLGATYNQSTGLYALNGLDDITEAQMKNIIRVTHGYRPQYDMVSRFRAQPVGFRTNFVNGTLIAGDSNTLVNGYYMAANNTTLEVLKLYSNIANDHTESLPSSRMRFGDCRYMFAGSTNLRKVIGIIHVGNITDAYKLGSAFGDANNRCTSLEEVRIMYLRTNLNLRYAPNLDEDSLVYIVINVFSATNPLTITLDDDAYTAIKSSVAMVEALAVSTGVTLANASGTYKWNTNIEYKYDNDAWVAYNQCRVLRIGSTQRVDWSRITTQNSGAN